MTNPTIIIIGAGISGLALAFRLGELAPDAAITLLEHDQRPGGTAWTLREGGFQLEIGPNGFLDTKPTTIGLCRDLGIGERLVKASAAAGKNRFLFLGDQLKMLPGGLAALCRTDLLSWRGKLNFFLEPIRRAPANAPDESVDAFARRRAGKEAAEVFADALVTGIFAGDPKLLSLPACFPRLAALEREYGGILAGMARSARERRRAALAQGQAYQRPGKMWSLREGLRLLVETLAARLKQPPVCGAHVRQVARRPDAHGAAWTVWGDGQDRWSADAVVLTCPAHQQAALLEQTDAALADEIAGIPYNAIAVVGLGYRRADVPCPLEGFGYIAPQRSRRDILGAQWCSSIFPERAPAGAVLLRTLCGGWHRADVASWPDDRLAAAARAELGLAMGITAAPIFQKIIRWPRAIPQYHVGHLARLHRIDNLLTRHPGLFSGGNAYRGVALNDCTEQASVLAARILAHVRP